MSEFDDNPFADPFAVSIEVFCKNIYLSSYGSKNKALIDIGIL